MFPFLGQSKVSSPLANKLIAVFEGDSITAEYGRPSGTSTWVRYLNTYTTKFRKSRVWKNVALGGDTANLMRAEYATQGHIYRPKASNEEGWFFIYAGINDLNASTSAATIYGYLKTIWASARADGFVVVAATVHQTTLITGAKETQRGLLNTSIKSDLTLFDCLADLDGLGLNPASTTLFLDGVHSAQGGAGASPLFAKEFARAADGPRNPR